MALGMAQQQGWGASMDKVQPTSADNDSATEHFLVYGYKVVPCSKRYRHDWSVCPFAHTGEMAARRDPSRYLPIFCFHSKQRLPCPRGDDCPYSHNLFEYWLHPQRYRTEMCQFGAACTRPVCFFAHGEHQLRHTSMPGGPQPVVAPPEPIPSLNGGYGSRELGGAVDPAVKQQQQLMALQAAAAGFSHQQQHGGQQHGGQQHGGPQGQHHHAQHQQQQAAAAAVVAAAAAAAGNSNVGLPSVDPLSGRLQHVGSFPSLMDGNAGTMDGLAYPGQGQLQGQLSLAGGQLPASSPLSAPLPQLSPDMLAALQGMSGGGGPGALSPMGGGGPLLHQHSGMPTHFDALPTPGRLQRSLTAHPTAMHAAAAANSSSAANLDELSQQLAVMQLMQGGGPGGGGLASGPLPELGSQHMDQLLSLAHLQQQQQEQQQRVAAVAASQGLDLSRLLPVSSAGLAGHDSSMSCPLVPVYGMSGSSATHQHPAAAAAQQQHASAGMQHTHLVPAMPLSAVSCGLPRVPTEAGSSFGAPSSPAASDKSRDAPSPEGTRGRDTQVPAPSKRGQPWSAPVSPCTSTGKGGGGGNDLAPPADAAKRSSISFPVAHQSSTASSSSASSGGGAPDGGGGGGANGLAGGLAPGVSNAASVVEELPSFSSNLNPNSEGGAAAAAHAVSAPLLMLGEQPMEAAQVQAALRGGQAAAGGRQQQLLHDTIGHEKAAALLANMDEAAVRKLLALVQQ